MRTIDTNIVARILLDDDPNQTRRAVEVVGSSVTVPISVVLEAQWLLASRYRWERGEIAAALRIFLEVETVHVDDRPLVAWAIGRYANGADLADMVHLILSGKAEAFVTFDRSLARKAGKDAPVRIETLRD